jgi:hypothetical protein
MMFANHIDLLLILTFLSSEFCFCVIAVSVTEEAGSIGNNSGLSKSKKTPAANKSIPDSDCTEGSLPQNLQKRTSPRKNSSKKNIHRSLPGLHILGFKLMFVKLKIIM